MQKKKSVESTIKEKIEYLGLNFKRVPKSLIATDNLNFKALKGYDEKQYKQYKFIKIKDIDILLTPKHRLDNLSEKYEAANPLYMYLDSEHQENATKYATFLSMLKKVDISEVEKIEDEQKMLSKKLPFRVKFNGNYLWQIYYSERSDRYFMLVPTEDTDYSTFFYLLKKKIENKKEETIFVPISYLDYSGSILGKSELKDIENYLWLFTKDYPSIYEITDKKGNESLQIIGETRVYGRIKTLYKLAYNTPREASKFYKLLKAIFILQVELPHYYQFETNINEDGELEIHLDGEEVRYEKLLEFVASQYEKSIELKEQNEEEVKSLEQKLSSLKRESIELEKEYLEKEKIITTFLECKKSFFGKVKYYFRFGKKAQKGNKEKRDKKVIQGVKNEEEKQEENIRKEDKKHTLEELILSFKEVEKVENKKKNLIQDINAIKLKNKNLKKKIENATLYINEINEHKKSIFEFWKYSNKDEVAALEEGEQEEVNVSKIEKTFNYDSDFEDFGEKVDKKQRLKFTDSELDSCYLASTDILNYINVACNDKVAENKDFTAVLRKLKKEKDAFLPNGDDQDFDIFGATYQDGKKERLLGNKTHRETPRNKYEILGITKSMKTEELKKAFVEAGNELKKALKKNSLEEEIYVYKASKNRLDFNEFELFSLNEEKELKEYFMDSTIKDEIYLYRLKLKRGTNFVALSNIIFYNNKNMTLPVGMNESDKILIDINSLNINEVGKKEINVKKLKDEKDDFSELALKVIEVYELES